MSGKQTGIVWELDLALPKKIVLLAMADSADQDGNDVYPSIGLIAWKTGYSARQVQRIVNSLKDDKLIELVEKEYGRYHTVNYSLRLEGAKRMPKYSGRNSLDKDIAMVEVGKKAKATREARLAQNQPSDMMMSHPPVTQDVIPPVTSGCHTNGSGTSVKTGDGDSKSESPSPSLDEQIFSRSQETTENNNQVGYANQPAAAAPVVAPAPARDAEQVSIVVGDTVSHDTTPRDDSAAKYKARVRAAVESFEKTGGNAAVSDARLATSKAVKEQTEQLATQLIGVLHQADVPLKNVPSSERTTARTLARMKLDDVRNGVMTLDAIGLVLAKYRNGGYATLAPKLEKKEKNSDKLWVIVDALDAAITQTSSTDKTVSFFQEAMQR